MTTALSNHYKYQKGLGLIDLNTDTLKIVLMTSGFAFDPDTHATYADVLAAELAAGNGYTQNNKTLSQDSLVEDDTNNKAVISLGSVSWAAAGGSIGPAAGAIIFDDTTADDTVIGYIDFGGDQTATDGGTFAVNNMALEED